MTNHTDVTFYTISDERFFPGTVALLNSLRLTGNGAPLVVLDVGLSDTQRARLEQHATVVSLPAESPKQPTLFKAFPSFFDPRGVVVIIDSDMMVVRSLQDVIGRAAGGRICVFPDPNAGRWFSSWETSFELKAPLRRQTYVNAGFVAFSMEHWPDLLARFWELCGQTGWPLRSPTGEAFSRFDMEDQPLWAGDQDALNALLMSEIPPDALGLLPTTQEVYPDKLMRHEGRRPRVACMQSGWGATGDPPLRDDAQSVGRGGLATSPSGRLRTALRSGYVWQRCPIAHGAARAAAVSAAENERTDRSGRARPHTRSNRQYQASDAEDPHECAVASVGAPESNET